MRFNMTVRLSRLGRFANTPKTTSLNYKPFFTPKTNEDQINFVPPAKVTQEEPKTTENQPESTTFQL